MTLAVGASARATPEDDVRRIVAEERERGGTPAMCVVVVRDGQVLVELASGLTDQEAGRPATLDTQVPAASVSKVLTAVLVMRQVEEGRLDLDKPVNTYLEPAFWVRNGTGEPAPATLRSTAVAQLWTARGVERHHRLGESGSDDGGAPGARPTHPPPTG